MNIDTIRKFAVIPITFILAGISYTLLSAGYWSLAGPMLGGLIGALIGTVVIVQQSKKENHVPLLRDPVDLRIAMILSSGYILFVILTYRVVTYEQPWMHYLVLGLYAGFVGYEIASGASRKRVVFETLTLCFFTYWSTQFAFPAGMFGPDTLGKYLPVIQSALETGFIRSYIIYLGHLVYVTEFAAISGLSAKTAYYLLATLVLTGTVLILSIADIAIPVRPKRVTLYGALIFGCMSWTLNRGFHPNKLNFFYPLILLVGMSAFGASVFSDQSRFKWLIIGIIISPAIIFGHRFSAGASLIFLLSIGMFIILVSKINNLGYNQFISKTSVLFVAAYGIALFGNPIHQTGLMDRLNGIILSIMGGVGVETAYAGTGGLTGPGRYSQFSVEFLIMNTSAQALLFAMAVLGVVIAFRRINLGFDFSIFWMATLGIFLFIGLVFNSADTQPQRFYSYLALFGLNISAGMVLVFIQNHNSKILSRACVAVLLGLFVVLSLFSPVAGQHISPAGDRLPHYQKFQTEQDDTGIEWIDNHVQNKQSLLTAIYSSSELPYTMITQNEIAVSHSQMPSDTVYLYSEWTRTTGVTFATSGRGIGARRFGFLTLDQDPQDDMIYSNGKSTVYINE